MQIANRPTICLYNAPHWNDVECLDLKLSSDDKQLLVQAASLEGMTLAAFVRSAAKKQASEAILRERQLQLPQSDFAAFHAAIHEPFRPSPPLQEAVQRARTQVRRA